MKILNRPAAVSFVKAIQKKPLLKNGKVVCAEASQKTCKVIIRKAFVE